MTSIHHGSLKAWHRAAWPLKRVGCVLVLGLLLVGCHQQSTPKEKGAKQDEDVSDYETYPASVNGLNYSSSAIAGFSITDASGRTGGGPNISPVQSNGDPSSSGEMCCVIVPAKWREGMTVTVEWERDTHPYDHNDRSGDQWLKAVAKVPPYKKEVSHGFWVRFLPGDRIVVQVNDQEWYTPNPITDQERYVVQGVLDEQANREFAARIERERKAEEEYLLQLQAEKEKAANQHGGTKQ